MAYVNKLPFSQSILYRDYDDSSDEEINLNYGEVGTNKINKLAEEVKNFKLLHSDGLASLPKEIKALETTASENTDPT